MENVSKTILPELDYLPIFKNKKDYKIGIIGTGRIALRRQIPTYQYAGLNVVAVADINQDALDQARKLYGIEQAYLDYHQLLDQKDIDIVDMVEIPI